MDGWYSFTNTDSFLTVWDPTADVFGRGFDNVIIGFFWLANGIYDILIAYSDTPGFKVTKRGVGWMFRTYWGAC